MTKQDKDITTGVSRQSVPSEKKSKQTSIVRATLTAGVFYIHIIELQMF